MHFLYGFASHSRTATALALTGDLGCYVRRQEMIDIVEEEVRESLGETAF